MADGVGAVLTLPAVRRGHAPGRPRGPALAEVQARPPVIPPAAAYGYSERDARRLSARFLPSNGAVEARR
jgi:hypothetical protein